MSGHIERDIYEEVEYMPITLRSDKIKVGIIGGGKAALIKVKAFNKKNVNIEVLSIEFIKEFASEVENSNIKLIDGYYNEDFILDKHIIVIAINDSNTISEVINHCNKYTKIFINSASHKEGLATLPAIIEGKHIIASVNTKEGNPKGAVLVSKKIKKVINEYDSFISFSTHIRNNVQLDRQLKMELLTFVNSEDFKYIFEKGKHIDILNLFYGDELKESIEKIIRR